MSAHEELQRDGQFGAHCMRLLNRLIQQEAQAAPGLDPQRERPDLAYEDLAHEFFLGKGEAITSMLLAEAREDGQFSRILRRAVKNWLIDCSRTDTDTGALRFRLEKLLPARVEFERVPKGRPGAGRWRAADGPDEVFAGDVEDLARAGRAVPVKTVLWDSDTRRTPVTDTPSLVRLLQRIFETAGGSLEFGQILYAVRGRFPVQLAGELPLDHRADSSQRLAPQLRAGETAESGLDLAESEARIERLARRVRDRLDHDDLRVLDVLDDPDKIAERLGVRRSQAYVRRKKVAAVFTEVVGDDPDRWPIVREVMVLDLGPSE